MENRLIQYFCRHVFLLSFISGKCFSLFYICLFLYKTVAQILELQTPGPHRFFFFLLPYPSSVDGELKNICSTSLALTALVDKLFDKPKSLVWHELLPQSLEAVLLKLLRNACEIRALSAICVGA